MEKKITCITIDPGLSSGYAIWDAKWKLLNFGLCLPDEKEIWEVKAYEVAAKLKKVAIKWGCSKGYIEYPAFFEIHGASGIANSGALVKLAFLVGLICGTIPFLVQRVEVRIWKGNLPKEVVIKRILRILPNIKARKDMWDAIGMGLFLKGDLK